MEENRKITTEERRASHRAPQDVTMGADPYSGRTTVRALHASSGQRRVFGGGGYPRRVTMGNLRVVVGRNGEGRCSGGVIRRNGGGRQGALFGTCSK